MLKITGVKIPLSQDADYAECIAKKLSLKPECIKEVKLIRKSLDARRKGSVCYVCTFAVRLTCDERALLGKDVSLYNEEEYSFSYHNLSSEKRPVIIGSGPAGLFCAFLLAKAGLRPLVFERGADVKRRTEAVERLRSEGILDADTNVQFGEGGAGTFSDGKLTCGLNDIRTPFVLKTFVSMGAPEEILYLAKPHIGTDYLRGVVVNIRKAIEDLGGEICFDSIFEDFDKDPQGRVSKIYIRNTTTGKLREIPCDTLVLALGHSARDTYRMLNKKGLNMSKKPFSVGVRIEHRREYINLIRYKDISLSETLPAADYKLSCHPDGRGVYTFCMCPGGEVVCSSSQEGGVVTNGMSYFARDKENSNSALLVSVYPEDTGDDVFSGMYLQEEMERKAFILGGGGFTAPCQRVGDFLKGEATTKWGEVKPSYLPGVKGANLWEILPPFVANSLKSALKELDTKLRGFLFEDAVLTGVETRSSAPIRIVRDEDMQSSQEGIYPIGEGAGYAGGIMSAAIDGIKCAEIICRICKNK